MDREETFPVKTINTEKTTRFLYLSNFVMGKGHIHAIKAFHRILPSLSEKSQLVFIGGDLGLNKNRRYKSELIKLGHSLGIDHQIIFKEFDSEIEAAYKSSDIFLNFSDGESFSMTCLEASFFGVPTIATACGGPAEIIDHNKTGILVEVGNIEEMAEAMIRLSEDKKLQSFFSENSKLHVRRIFDPSVQGKRLVEIYSH
jgi:glycosyltransferase involved in cell wall biosynthesis